MTGEREHWRAARVDAVEEIHARLTAEGIDHTVDYWLTLIRIELPGAEIGIDPSDEAPGAWNVILHDHGQGPTTATELGRTGGHDWPPTEAVPIIHDHLVWSRRNEN